ncbi:Polypyrimidine tract-binding protein 2 [Halotydeus destructor]|nr:Polypyrimidine tract-binding protein 2 [Halotydeus destructor]
MQVKRPADDLYGDNNGDQRTSDGRDVDTDHDAISEGQAMADSVKCFNNNTIDIASKKLKTETETDSIASGNGVSIGSISSPPFNGSTGSGSPTTVTAHNGSGDNGGHVENGHQNGSHVVGTSKVVHVRNVPSTATDSDLYTLALPFGKVNNVIVMRQKGQAFLEFDDPQAATCMVSLWQVNGPSSPMVKGQPVFCQFSKHQVLKPKFDNQSRSSYGGGDNQSSYSPASGYSSPAVPGETSVVRAVVDNLVYPVTVDTFHQLFSRFGKVSKIVTFNKNNALQALIQFDSNYSAQSAKATLDGHAMFGGNSNVLRVDFSKLTNLNVKYNNDKSRDYTNPSLPVGNAPYGHGGDMSSGGHGMSGIDPMTMAALSGQSPLGFASPHQHSAAAIGQSASSHHLTGYRAQSNGSSSSGGHGMGAMSASSGLGVHPSMMGFGTVLLVSNLAEQVLFNKKDNALIQMAEPSQSSLALQSLNNLKVFGKPMRVTSSKHGVVQMPKDGQPDSGLTKDYTSSPLHRFKKPGSKNYSNIYPPSATLHLSNIPPSVDEAQIRQAFLGNLPGTNIVNFKFFPKDRKMALMQLPTIEDSVMALIKMHNYQLAESAHLRVSFAKSSI